MIIDRHWSSRCWARASTEEISPVKARDRDVYLPNSEDLGPEEMRVIACGTGMPNPRMAQAAACFLVELGNGDKFIFDIGSGWSGATCRSGHPLGLVGQGLHRPSARRPFRRSRRSLRRRRRRRPACPVANLGTRAARHRSSGPPTRSGTWRRCTPGTSPGGSDRRTSADSPPRCMSSTTRKPQVIYEENGVTIRSWPAIHAIDGAVSFSLEWAGLKFVFSSDTFPNKWFNEYGQDADLAIHECFIAVPDLITKWRLTPEAALQVGTQIHTAPEAFGKVMSTIKPRHAIAYHFFKDHDTTGPILERIRKTYDGPLSLAEDHMVWNVTKDKITERVALVNEHTWNPPMASPAFRPIRTTGLGTRPRSGLADSTTWTRSSGRSTKRRARRLAESSSIHRTTREARPQIPWSLGESWHAGRESPRKVGLRASPSARLPERYRCEPPTPRFEDLAGVVRDRPGTFATA